MDVLRKLIPRNSDSIGVGLIPSFLSRKDTFLFMTTGLKNKGLLVRLAVVVFVWAGLMAPLAAAGPQTKRPVKPKAAPAAAKAPAAESSSPSSNTSETEMANKRIVDFLRAAALSLSPDVDMSVVSRLPSKFGNLETVTVAITEGSNTFRQEVLATPDNRYAFIPARIFDLSQNPFAETMRQIHISNSPMRGNPNAKVTIVEFSDFECPVCGQAYKTIEGEVMKQYGDRVRLVYKNFPLPQHPWAEGAAVAAMCAYSQKPESFWTFYHGFFDNQTKITKDTVRGSAMTFARSANLDMTKFQQCYDQKQTLPRIDEDMKEGAALGILGTPLFLINGHPLTGAQPFAMFQKILDPLLKDSAQ